MKIAILGLGEAGSHFANDLVRAGVSVCGWDPDPRRPLDRAVELAQSNPDAVAAADIVFSVNLPSVSEAVAREVRDALRPDAIYCSMNTSAPATKRSIASILSPIAVVDLAIMAPVPPTGIRTPMLASGSAAADLAARLGSVMEIEVLNDRIGDAAGRKLLRSIVYKGIAAVVCEAIEAGRQQGLEPYIREQIRSIIGDDDALIDRFINGSRTHAGRRVHEMEAVVEMLGNNQSSALMSTAAMQNLRRYAGN